MKALLRRCKTGWWAEASAFGIVRSELGNCFEFDDSQHKGVKVETAVYHFLERNGEPAEDAWSSDCVQVCKIVSKGSGILQEIQLTAKLNIDRTGTICTWPTSEIGAYFCFCNPSLFQSKTVIELGAGTGKRV